MVLGFVSSLDFKMDLKPGNLYRGATGIRQHGCVLFGKIKVRPHSCQFYPPWCPCYELNQRMWLDFLSHLICARILPIMVTCFLVIPMDYSKPHLTSQTNFETETALPFSPNCLCKVGWRRERGAALSFTGRCYSEPGRWRMKRYNILMFQV